MHFSSPHRIPLDVIAPIIFCEGYVQNMEFFYAVFSMSSRILGPYIFLIASLYGLYSIKCECTRNTRKEGRTA